MYFQTFSSLNILKLEKKGSSALFETALKSTVRTGLRHVNEQNIPVLEKTQKERSWKYNCVSNSCEKSAEETLTNDYVLS